MQVSALTQLEADYFEIVCNFTDDELTLFRLRLKNVPLEECAEIMNRSVDSVKKISRKINKKCMDAS